MQVIKYEDIHEQTVIDYIAATTMSKTEVVSKLWDNMTIETQSRHKWKLYGDKEYQKGKFEIVIEGGR